jgi:hypothetical protein
MRKLVLTSVLAIPLALPAVARAQWYAGLAVGAGGARVPAGSYAAGVRGMLRLYAGYEFTPKLGVEAMTFDLGSPDKPSGSESTIGAFGVAAVGTLPVQRWRFTGRAGVMWMDGRADIAETKHTTQPMLALGAGYDVIPELTLGLEVGVSRVEFGSPLDEKANVNWTGLAATYRF